MDEPRGIQTPVESKNSKTVLVIVAVAVVVVTVAGAVYFLYSNDLNDTPTDLNLYDVSSVDFLPSEGAVFSSEIPIGEDSLAQYTLFGRILGEPNLNQETDEISFLAEFPSGDGHIVGDVILGVADGNISVSYIQANQINTDNFTYNRVKVSDVASSISSGGTVYVTFTPIDVIPEYYINNSICDEGCMQRLMRSVELYEDTNRLIEAISAGNSISEAIVVGPVSQLVLYSE